MPSPLRILSRLASSLALALALAALLLGRSGREAGTHSPPAPRERATPREPAPPRYRAFDGKLFLRYPRAPRLLDTQTGAIDALEIPGGETLEALSASPWRDAGGRHHVVGRWRGDAGAAGAVRFTFPGGRVLDRIAFAPVLVSPPCWFPDRSDRIVFAAADGRLYLLDFRELTEPEGGGPRPRSIGWTTAPPGIDVSYIQQPCWPSGSALGGCLVATILLHDSDAEPGSRGRSQLWWLRLSPEAIAIVAAGRLIVPEESATGPEVDEYAPGVGTTSEGEPILAYLAGLPDEGPAELRAAPITIEGESTGRVPRVRAGATRRLAAVDVSTAPAFSPDGRWVYAAVRSPSGCDVTVRRIEIPPGTWRVSSRRGGESSAHGPDCE